LAKHTEETFPAIYLYKNAPTEPSRLQVTPSRGLVAPRSLFPGVHLGFTGGALRLCHWSVWLFPWY